eukprot:SAG11_NODE_4222_length_2004_cov_1.156955_3_plen_117_part_01
MGVRTQLGERDITRNHVVKMELLCRRPAIISAAATCAQGTCIRWNTLDNAHSAPAVYAWLHIHHSWGTTSAEAVSGAAIVMVARSSLEIEQLQHRAVRHPCPLAPCRGLACSIAIIR